MQRFDSTKFSKRKPFRKFGAIEPTPFCCQGLLWIKEQCNGSTAPNFMKGSPSEKLVLSNRPSLLSVFAMSNTSVQRFDCTKFSEKKPFKKKWCYRTALRCPHWKTQRFDSGFPKLGAIEPPLAVPNSNGCNGA